MPFQGSLIKAEEVSPEKGFWDCNFYIDHMETNWNKQDKKNTAVSEPVQGL